MWRLLWALILLLAITAAGCGNSPTRHPAAPEPVTVTTGQSAGGSVHPPGWGTPAPPSLRVAVPLAAGVATMYDSITLSTIPANPFALAGYTAGFWPTYLPMRARWPSAHTVSIAIAARYHADCADVEPGDLTPEQAPGWVQADKAAGFAKPCLYSDYSEWTTRLIPILNRARIALHSIWKWVASYDGIRSLIAGFDAKQYTDAAFGRNLDASIVTRPFLSIAQPPLVPNRAALLARREVLRHVLVRYGCRQRKAEHHTLGPKCKRWFAEGNRIARELA